MQKDEKKIRERSVVGVSKNKKTIKVFESIENCFGHEAFVKAVFEKLENLPEDIRSHFEECNFCQKRVFRERKENPIYSMLIEVRKNGESEENFWEEIHKSIRGAQEEISKFSVEEFLLRVRKK